MQQNGKVLFFNVNEGNGIIITSNKEKIDFSVREWDDFETMPALGLKVYFTYSDGAISNITTINPEEDESEEKTQIQEEDTPTNSPDESVLEDAAQEDLSDTDGEETLQATEEATADTSKPDEETDTVDENTENQTGNEENIQDENLASEGTEPEEMEAEDIEAQSDDSDEQNDIDPEEEALKTQEALSNIENGIEDLQEEIGERKESLTLTLNISNAVANYFEMIKENVNKRKKYLSLDGRLDYLTIRRFLWTTYNNVSEIDLHIITPKIKSLSDDLKAMSKVYDDFVIKTKHPKLAYEEVFLSCQKEYMTIRNAAEKTLQRLSQLQNSEKHLGGVLKIKKEDLKKQIDTEEFDILQEELKSLNGTYVDVVHMMAELDERYKSDMKLLIEFEAEYKRDFNDLFMESAVSYKKVIVDILSAQACLLDSQLWNKAKTSKAVAAHFHKAGIKGELNTRTYLKYYLDTQDSSKAKGETKKLFELYEYLCAAEKDFILIMSNDANDAMEFESTIKRLDKKFEVKAFLDEKKALRWAMQNSIKVVIVEDRLPNMSGEAFLKFYKKYVVVNPKIISLGNIRKSEEYSVTKMLPKGVSTRALGQEVLQVLQ